MKLGNIGHNGESDGSPNKTKPLVSVIIPTYGDGKYLPGAIQSVRTQSYDKIEIVIIDSTGYTDLEPIAAKSQDITYLNHPPSGPSAARNRGIEAAQGDVIAFLDADDRWLQTKIERQIDELRGGADIVYTDTYCVNAEELTMTYWNALPIHDKENHHIDVFKYHDVPCLTVAARAELFEGEKFDEELTIAEDWHMWVRLFRKGTPSRIDEPLAIYFDRGKSLTSDIDQAHRNSLLAMRKLVDQLPELKPYTKTRRREINRLQFKRLIRQGRRSEARRLAIDLVMVDNRTYKHFVYLLISFLPYWNEACLDFLERLYSRWFNTE